MTVTINGTTGIAGVDGSAATPAVQGGDANTGMFFPAADQVGLAAGGSQVLLVNASGSTITGTQTVTGTQSVSGDLSFNSGYGSAAVAYGCRAWVNFDGTTNTAGFCTIRASGNVTSVADNGTGVYTVNFTTAMPDINYAVAATSMEVGTTGTTDRTVSIRRNTLVSDSMATTFVKVAGWTASGSVVDSGVTVVSVFR